MHKTLQFRVKNLEGELNRQSRAVNFVWNFCNDTQKHALRWWKKWPSYFDLTYLVASASSELGILSSTMQAICKQYAASRRQHRKPYLRYRGRKSLGWIPFKAVQIRAVDGGFLFCGHVFKVFDPRALPGKILNGGNFSQDAKGNWFLNIIVELPDTAPQKVTAAIGIDLGLKDFAALSNGEKVEAPRHYRRIQERLAVAQRARKKRLARDLQVKAGNCRKDFLHKLSHRLTNEFSFIAVGNVNAAALAKTNLAKSVNDAGWSTFRNMLSYKSIANGGRFLEVSERFTTQICSECGALPAERPEGIADLGIREWTCSDCGTHHDRDVNAARNILRRGHAALAVGIAASRARELPESPEGIGAGMPKTALSEKWQKTERKNYE